MKELITAPWPWYVAGPLITLVMVLMLLFGKSFGISSTLKTVCSIGGAGRWSDFFRFDWKSASWNLFFAAGAILGGYIASTFMAPERAIALNPATVASLQTYGIDNAGTEFLPREIFNLQNLLTGQGLIFMVLGGFMVGFGTRYADGCTSGHGVCGMSRLSVRGFAATACYILAGVASVAVFRHLLEVI